MVHRFEADGRVDATFGSAGRVAIALPTVAGVDATRPLNARGTHDVVIGPGGSIYFATAVQYNTLDGRLVVGSLVARLTADGRLDPGFGVGGVIFLGGNYTEVADVAVLGDGKLLIYGNSLDQYPGLFVSRYTTAGVLDTTLNGNGTVRITSFGPTANNPGITFYSANGIQADRFGQVYLASTGYTVASPGADLLPATFVVRLSPVGVIDSAYGLGGVAVASRMASPTDRVSVSDIAFQSDGKIVLGGNYGGAIPSALTGYVKRLTTVGTVDMAFDGTFDGTNPTDGRVDLPGLGVASVRVGADDSINVGGQNVGADPLDPTFPRTIGVARLLADGTADAGFGFGGRYTVPLGAQAAGDRRIFGGFTALALTADGDPLVAGILTADGSDGGFLAKLRRVRVTMLAGDYDGDGRSDISALVAGPALYAYRPSAGGDDALPSFGVPGVGVTIPAPGDYDGDGTSDLAVYIPAQGKLYYRQSSSGLDRNVALGDASSIPAPGDYDGDGRTDPAVYDPATGSFLIRDSSTGQSRTVQFGSTGVDASVPAPGDYDGDGKTDLAVYIPQYAGFAIAPSSAGNMSSDVLQSFGVVGQGATVPAPGDYDGDGKTDIAGYIPQFAIYAYRPSSTASSSDVLTSFGTAGSRATVPAASIPYAQPIIVSRMALASAGDGDAPIALTDDVLAELAGLAGKKKRA